MRPVQEFAEKSIEGSENFVYSFLNAAGTGAGECRTLAPEEVELWRAPSRSLTMLQLESLPIRLSSGLAS